MCKNLYEQRPTLVRAKTTKNEHGDLTSRIIELLVNDPGQPVKELAKKLKINRTFLSRYLKALENQDFVKSKKIGPAKVYFKENMYEKGGK